MSLPGLDLRALGGYFRTALPHAGAELRAELITGGKSNLTYLITDGVQRWVLRRPPLGPLTPSAHDMVREYRVVQALRPTGFPVAEPILLHAEPDVLGAPFSVVSFVEGRTLRDGADAAALTPAAARRCAHGLADTLAALHSIEVAEVGLTEFGRPDGYLARQVRRWRDQWDRVATRESTDIDRLRSALEAALPTHGDARVVHGDYRLDNTILATDDPGVVRAVVDWEMATIGDPLADLGLLHVYWDPVTEPVLGVRHAPSANPGFPGADDIAARYARATGAELSELPFYRALGYFKLAVIAEGIHRRHRAGATVGAGFDTAGAAVPPLLAAGLRTVRAPRR